MRLPVRWRIVRCCLSFFLFSFLEVKTESYANCTPQYKFIFLTFKIFKMQKYAIHIIPIIDGVERWGKILRKYIVEVKTISEADELAKSLKLSDNETFYIVQLGH